MTSRDVGRAHSPLQRVSAAATVTAIDSPSTYVRHDNPALVLQGGCQRGLAGALDSHQNEQPLRPLHGRARRSHEILSVRQLMPSSVPAEVVQSRSRSGQLLLGGSIFRTGEMASCRHSSQACREGNIRCSDRYISIPPQALFGEI